MIKKYMVHHLQLVLRTARLSPSWEGYPKDILGWRNPHQDKYTFRRRGLAHVKNEVLGIRFDSTDG